MGKRDFVLFFCSYYLVSASFFSIKRVVAIDTSENDFEVYGISSGMSIKKGRLYSFWEYEKMLRNYEKEQQGQ